MSKHPADADSSPIQVSIAVLIAASFAPAAKVILFVNADEFRLTTTFVVDVPNPVAALIAATSSVFVYETFDPEVVSVTVTSACPTTGAAGVTVFVNVCVPVAVVEVIPNAAFTWSAVAALEDSAAISLATSLTIAS